MHSALANNWEVVRCRLLSAFDQLMETVAASSEYLPRSDNNEACGSSLRIAPSSPRTSTALESVGNLQTYLSPRPPYSLFVTAPRKTFEEYVSLIIRVLSKAASMCNDNSQLPKFNFTTFQQLQKTLIHTIQAASSLLRDEQFKQAIRYQTDKYSEASAVLTSAIEKLQQTEEASGDDELTINHQIQDARIQWMAQFKQLVNSLKAALDQHH